MGRKKLSFTTRYVLAFGLLLLIANTLLGIVVLRQSERAMKSLINKNMLDIVNSASGLLDGDVLGALTEADVDGPAFTDIKEKLTVFQKNVDIRFIYAVRQADADTYVFTVDPDPVDPGAFGEEVVVTDALVEAGKGVATVDDIPVADRWGNFYSAYSPVFDSRGNVAGIVGIDFDAEWYEAQVRNHTISITVVTILSVLIGGAVVFIITHGVRKRFQQLDGELSKLSDSVDQVMDEVGAISGRAVSGKAGASIDEIEVLADRIHAMQTDMVVYLDYLHQQAYTDPLTRVGSAAAYHERIQELEERIASGTARFSVAVFDVNNLKEINDNLGHERGDMAIIGAAEAIAGVFGAADTYRIGGDEIAVVRESIADAELRAVDTAVSAFNAAQVGVSLAVSKGVADYRAGVDPSFKQVFARADRAMYQDKKEYYETIGDRRARH